MSESTPEVQAAAAGAAEAVAEQQAMQAKAEGDMAVAAVADDAINIAERAETVAEATAAATEGVADLADTAATTAVQAQETADTATQNTLTVSEAIAELRQEMSSRFDSLHEKLIPLKDHQSEVTEVEVTGSGDTVGNTRDNTPERQQTSTPSSTRPATGRRRHGSRRG